MKIIFTVTALMTALPLKAAEPGPLRPFPQHTRYAPGTIIPSRVSRERLDAATLAFFQSWKAKYLVASRTPGQFYVFVDEEDEEPGPKKISVSEGHGYGMLITAFMAGAEPRAREFFDGLWRFAREHPSRINPRLMAWMQVTGEGNSPDGGDHAATDGDLDIAHALLLADAQWGSGGAVNYREEARTVIAAIKQDEINRETWTVKLGDWADAKSGMFFSTRASDFMPGHFRSFQKATGDADWARVVDAGYRIVDGIQTQFSPATGLLPDFVIEVNAAPKPPAGKFLEGKDDGHFSYNSCRVPFRLGLDCVLQGEPRAKAALERINTWVKKQTGGRPKKIVAGYDLGGRILDRDDHSIAFAACFGVGAMSGAAHQDWLNALWDYVAASDSPDDRYYGRTLKMLCLIALSGNWWSVEQPGN